MSLWQPESTALPPPRPFNPSVGFGCKLATSTYMAEVTTRSRDVEEKGGEERRIVGAPEPTSPQQETPHFSIWVTGPPGAPTTTAP